MARRLTELHPLTKKLRDLEQYMFENNIQLDWNGLRLEVTDTKTGTTAFCRDAENSQEITEFPYMFETKLNTLDDE